MASVRLLVLVLGAALLVPCAARASWSRGHTLCPTLADGPGGGSLLSFVWPRADRAPALLVRSAWDAQGRLLGCAARGEPPLLTAHLALCRRPLERARGWPELRRRLRTLEAQKSACPGLDGAPAERQPLRRVRRGWTMPGTLWCGAGDSAVDANQLGVFQGPDVCCREHDLCDAQISALAYNYGMRNYRLHTISHCDCDTRFRQCLTDLNDTISNFIGISFFNLLEVPCFVLEESEECQEWHWWGGCKMYGPMPLARLVEQSPYHSVLPSGESPGLATPPPHPGRRRDKGRKHGRKNWKPPAQEAAGVQTLPPEHPEPQTRITPLMPTLSATSGPGGPPATKDPGSQQAHTRGTLPSPAVQEGKLFSRTSGHGPSPAPARLAPSQSCGCYRRLDQCPYRIMPYEVKYQLHNSDFRILFHCNCTRRLARFLRKTKGPNQVEGEVLSNYVSSSCFVLQTPPGCTEGEEEQPNCIEVGQAFLTPARHLTNRLAQRHLGTSLKVKRQERGPPARPLHLFKKCLQLAQGASRAGPH